MHRYGPMYGPDVPPGPETIGWMARQRMRSFEMTEIGARGLMPRPTYARYGDCPSGA
jgi:hypothetical protein